MFTGETLLIGLVTAVSGRARRPEMHNHPWPWHKVVSLNNRSMVSGTIASIKIDDLCWKGLYERAASHYTTKIPRWQNPPPAVHIASFRGARQVECAHSTIAGDEESLRMERKRGRLRGLSSLSPLISERVSAPLRMTHGGTNFCRVEWGRVHPAMPFEIIPKKLFQFQTPWPWPGAARAEPPAQAVPFGRGRPISPVPQQCRPRLERRS
jgi:hypothetical protein